MTLCTARAGLCRVRPLLLGLALSATVPAALAVTSPELAADSDHDGLSDSLEQALLDRFAPAFHVDSTDCAVLPARFAAGVAAPTVAAVDGTLYGQASPRAADQTSEAPAIELHFYHLWPADCGRHGHALDAEHVSALLTLAPGQSPIAATSWHARFWYAAAHEDTVCDVSQITRAATLDATDHGAAVWISPGKHASFLALPLCRGGCGGDRCVRPIALNPPALLNLGEPGAPMNGSAWVRSPRWPLAGKMTHTDFPAASLARVEQLPGTDIAWVRPGRHPAQGTIAISGATADALGRSAANTGDALDRSGHNTDVALTLAGNSTGNALGKSYGKTRDALVRSAHGVKQWLNPRDETPSDAKPGTAAPN